MPGSLPHNETDLLLRVARGDQAAFALIFEQYHHDLGNFIYAITKSAGLTEEIVQNIFLKIWMGRETLAGIKSFKAYLFVISRNAAISALRQEIRDHIKKSEWAKTVHESTAAGEEWKEKEFYLSLIDQAIEALPPQRKKVYLLSRQDGLTYEEIAKRLGISKLTVRAHIQQAVVSITGFVKERGGLSLLLFYLGDSLF